MPIYLRLLLLACLAAVVASSRASAQELRPLGPLDERGVVTYFVATGAADARYRDEDRDLAAWAIGEWERAARGKLRFEPSDEATALVRLYWVEADAGQYGETRTIDASGRRGAAVFIRPDTDALGPDIAKLARADPLFRDTIVYLTCVHELGHALGLRHTANYADVMYFFGFGGDIPGFFMRYRKQLGGRADIARVSGLSAGDLAQLGALYPRVGAPGTANAIQVSVPPESAAVRALIRELPEK